MTAEAGNEKTEGKERGEKSATEETLPRAETRRILLKGDTLKSRERYERDLNPEQLAPVLGGDGYSLVLAGAGTGKTRVIIYRLAYLLDRGVDPRSVLLTTFTNRAARMMLSRAQALTNVPVSRLVGGTFHHICNILLRRYSDRLQYTRNFTILDDKDAESLMRIVRRDVVTPQEREKKLFPSAEIILRIYSGAINTNTTVNDLIRLRYFQVADYLERIIEVMKRYEERKQQDNLMDYDDLLVNTYRLMAENDDIRDKVASGYRFVLVDEFQDTNSLQAELADLWSSVHHNLMAVGDDAQSIYSFRGANFKNIIEFPDRYQDCKVFKLETNYRSTRQILDFTNEIDLNVPLNLRKSLRSPKQTGEKPLLIPLRDSPTQAEFVARMILRDKEEFGLRLSDFGVLYRTNALSEEFEVELRKRGIPYCLRGGLRFFERAHIKDLVSYLAFVHNSKDELSFKRILQQVPGVGEKTIDKYWEYLRTEGDPLELLIKESGIEMVPRRGRENLIPVISLIGEICKTNRKGNPGELLDIVFRQIYDEYMKSKFPNYSSRRDDVEQLIILASRYQDIRDFLTTITLESVQAEEVVGREETDAEEGAVTLTTIHQAKGLEWDTVFIVWFIDGILPHERSIRPEEFEEEKRLFYVSATRAKRSLYISYPLLRERYWTASSLAKPSRFLEPIPTSLYEQGLIATSEFGGSDF